MRDVANKSYYTADAFGYHMKDTGVLSHGTRQAESVSADRTKSSNQLINFLPFEEYDSLMSLGEIVTFSNGESVHQYGDSLTHLYFPLTAVFSLVQILEDGKICETALVGKEGCLGLLGMSNSSFVTSQWAETAIAGEVLRVNIENFNRRFDNSSVLRMRINEYTCFYIEQLSHKIICNCFHSVKEKLCDRLLTLQKKSEKSSFSATHESIARALGVQRPSISVIAKQLEREKLISYSRGQIKILEQAKLEDYACGCHTPFGECLSVNNKKIL